MKCKNSLKLVMTVLMLSVVFNVNAAELNEHMSEEQIIKSLKALSMEELDYLYKQGESEIPLGTGNGHTLTRLNITSKVLRNFWIGKIFYEKSPGEVELINRVPVLPRGKAFKASVKLGESYRDPGRNSVILDYSKNSIFPVSLIRDEIRKISKGVYLGYAYKRNFTKVPFIRFVLIFAEMRD